MRRLARWKIAGALTACAASAGLAVAGLQGCGGGNVTGPGNYTGGGVSITAFTVSPTSGKPGQTVTLKGLKLDDSTPVTIKFGAQEAVITQRGSGDTQVMVPVFLNNGAIKTPAAPLAVTAGTTDADKVMDQLHKIKIDDMFSKGYIRKDGTMIHDMYLMQVKSKKESKAPWDYYKVVATIPGEKAFTTEAESTCKLK